VTTVVIAGGGTGGHLFPGLAVAEQLGARGIAVHWVGSRHGLEATRLSATGIPVRLLPVAGVVGRGRFAAVAAALSLPSSVAVAAAHLLRLRTAAVLAVGGYAAVPAALAAGLLGVPLLLQEQNARPGLANRLLAPWADGIACGFRSALAAFPSLPAWWTGNPVRPAFFAVPPPDPSAGLLVLGGSQGSAFLNRLVPQALAQLPPAQRPRVRHQCGPRWLEEVRERYREMGVAAEVVSFLERPAEALAQALLVVARAGALTVCELAAARRFALLVPFAAAAHAHQLANARELAAVGAAEVLEEYEATPASTAALLARLLADPAALVARGQGGAVLAPPDAAERVSEAVASRAGLARPTPALPRGEEAP
jgi:UDP-N-acetylglucosamine--N-acetylmuramyl-(pentapeptide) pyrophosphoryl-undecaprenol N-acetylglucosamine transferase